MHLTIGIYGNDLGWQCIIQQEGISCKSVTNNSFNPDDYSIIIITENISDNDIKTLQAYINEGGAILCCGKSFQQLTKITCKYTKIKYILPSDEKPILSNWLIDINHHSFIPVNSNILKSSSGKYTGYFGTIGKGHILVLPFNPGKLLFDTRSSALSFYSSRHRLPYENVSLTSKGEIRKLIWRSIEFLHHKRNLPYLHLWYYPKNNRSIFSFRVDTDFANLQSLQNLLTLSEKHGIPFTWFLDVESQQHNLNFFKKLQNHEIGLHCYRHQKYNSVDKAISDTKLGIDILWRAGLDVQSFASPYGRWNNAIATAVNRYNFQYTSEFSYDYDNLPSKILLNEKLSEVIQVPIHPICIGNLRRQGFSKDEMICYFNSVINRKITESEPLIFYHHPNDSYEDVLVEVFNIIKSSKIPIMKMIDFAHWWKQRQKIKFLAEYNDSTLRINYETPSPDIWLHITKPNGTEAFTPLNSDINMNTLQWNQKQAPILIPKDIEKIRKYNPWIIIHKIEDILFKQLTKKILA